MTVFIDFYSSAVLCVLQRHLSLSLKSLVASSELIIQLLQKGDERSRRSELGRPRRRRSLHDALYTVRAHFGRLFSLSKF